jgi:hypothetical protein
MYNKYESEKICDNWGFYIDIENLNYVNQDNDEIMRKKYKAKKIENYNKFKNYENKINICETIYEQDMYGEDIYGEEFEIYDDTYINKKKDSLIVKVSSTTFITAILTYFIFFLI